MNKERIVNEISVIFDVGKKRVMRDKDFSILPNDFYGDIIVNGDLFLEEINWINGNVIVTGNMIFSRHLIVDGNITCYGSIISGNQDDLSARDINCFKRVYVGNLGCTSIVAKEIEACNIRAIDGIICGEVEAYNVYTSDFYVSNSNLIVLNALNVIADQVIAYAVNVCSSSKIKRIFEVKKWNENSLLELKTKKYY